MKRILTLLMFVLLTFTVQGQSVTLTSTSVEVYNGSSGEWEYDNTYRVLSTITITAGKVHLTANGRQTSFDVMDIHDSGNTTHFGISNNGEKWVEEVIVNFDDGSVTYFNSLRGTKLIYRDVELVNT